MAYLGVAGRGVMAVAEQLEAPFAAVLRRLRSEARLTQEKLAESAGVSARSVSDLERGVNLTARRDTSRLLADALGLAGPARAAFEEAARGRSPAAGVAVRAGVAATRALPRDIASFTGRELDLRRLAAAVETVGSAPVVGICAIGGMAGIGKTTFAIHAAHLLAPRFPDGQIFLPLHGYTPGQRPVDPADALASLLLVTGVAAESIPPGLEARAALWRDRAGQRRLLLVLDDAAGHDQVRPLLPASAGCLVLVTSRRHLTALEDAHTISLDTLPPGEAADLLIRLAGRPDLNAGDHSAAEITRLCGYFPLAIGMLGRQLHHHWGWRPRCHRLFDLSASLLDQHRADVRAYRRFVYSKHSAKQLQRVTGGGTCNSYLQLPVHGRRMRAADLVGGLGPDRRAGEPGSARVAATCRPGLTRVPWRMFREYISENTERRRRCRP